MNKNLTKYAALAALAAAVAFTACDKDENGNGKETPTSWESSKFGTVSFASPQTWTIGSQEWSDAVQATGCNKTDYKGYDTIANEFCADCRSNPDQKGDLFSWQAVEDYKDELCPEGWRVPDTADFRVLDSLLGGANLKVIVYIDAAMRDKYFSYWGGTYSGGCFSNGMLATTSTKYGCYWSQTEVMATSTSPALDSVWFGITQYLNETGAVGAMMPSYQYMGNALRCVRDI